MGRHRLIEPVDQVLAIVGRRVPEMAAPAPATKALVLLTPPNPHVK